MKLRVYITLVSGILLLGIVLSRNHNTAPASGQSTVAEPQYQQLYQQEATGYAEKIVGGPIKQWDVYDSPGELVVGYAMNKQGQQGCTIVYSKRTRQPRSILAQKCELKQLRTYKQEQAKEMALVWLRHIGLANGEQWQYLRERKSEGSRYVSFWRSNSFDVALALNAKTGHFLSLQIDENSEMARPKTYRSLSPINRISATRVE